jgi:uncharacterized damage-inducible protein DinB
MKTYFQNLFAYDAWANRRIVDALGTLPQPDERCLELVVHLLLAQRAWWQRVAGTESLKSVWERLDLATCTELIRQNNQDWLGVLDQTNDFGCVIAYRNLKGDAFESPLHDILTHVINHGTYHRGQVVTTLKTQNRLPVLPVTDFIVFARGN